MSHFWHTTTKTLPDFPPILADTPCDGIPCAAVLRASSILRSDCRDISSRTAVPRAALPLFPRIFLFRALPPAVLLLLLSHPPGHRPLRCRNPLTPPATLLSVATQSAATPSIRRDATCHTATRRPADRRTTAPPRRRAVNPPRRRPTRCRPSRRHPTRCRLPCCPLPRCHPPPAAPPAARYAAARHAALVTNTPTPTPQRRDATRRAATQSIALPSAAIPPSVSSPTMLPGATPTGVTPPNATSPATLPPSATLSGVPRDSNCCSAGCPGVMRRRPPPRRHPPWLCRPPRRRLMQ